MIANKFRFHGYGALKYLFGHGQTFRFKSLSVRVGPNTRRVNSRVAVVVGKKVIKSAPKRNRIRRRIFEIVRTNWDHIKPAHDILITINDPNYWELPSEQITEEVLMAFDRAGIWVDGVAVIEKENFKVRGHES